MRWKRLLCAVSLLLCVRSVAAQTEWTHGQTAALAAAVTLHLVDWGQTRHIAKDPDNFIEQGWMLPPQPSLRQVDAFMASTLVFWVVGANLFPEYRYYILGVWAASRLAVVFKNHQVGLRVSIGF